MKPSNNFSTCIYGILDWSSIDGNLLLPTTRSISAWAFSWISGCIAISNKVHCVFSAVVKNPPSKMSMDACRTSDLVSPIAWKKLHQLKRSRFSTGIRKISYFLTCISLTGQKASVPGAKIKISMQHCSSILPSVQSLLYQQWLYANRRRWCWFSLRSDVH